MRKLSVYGAYLTVYILHVPSHNKSGTLKLEVLSKRYNQVQACIIYNNGSCYTSEKSLTCIEHLRHFIPIAVIQLNQIVNYLSLEYILCHESNISTTNNALRVDVSHVYIQNNRYLVIQ